MYKNSLKKPRYSYLNYFIVNWIVYCSATDIVLYMMVYAKTASKTSLIFQCHYCSVQGKQYNLITYLFLIDKFTTFLSKSNLKFEVKRSNFSQQPQSHQLPKIEMHIRYRILLTKQFSVSYYPELHFRFM